MKVRHLVLAAGLIVAGSLAFFGDKTPLTGIVEPVAHPSKAKTGTDATPIKITRSVNATEVMRSAKQERESVILALQERETLIGNAHQEKATDGGLFGDQTWAPPPPPPAPPPKPMPPPPPTAPPLPFTYLGKKVEDGMWEVYLSRGEQTFIVRVQTVIDGIYRADSIKPPTLSLTYLPLNQVQTLAIGGHD